MASMRSLHCPVMQRASILLLVAASIFWQALIGPGQGGFTVAGEHMAHAVMHWLGTPHHHHEDGGHHLDDSKDSVRHVVFGGTIGSLALTTAVTMPILPVAAGAPSGDLRPEQPPPYLDPFRRPPRSLG